MPREEETDSNNSTTMVELVCPECETSEEVPEWWNKFEEVECKNCGYRFEIVPAIQKKKGD